MEQSTDMARTKREGLTVGTSELNESCKAETAGMIASDARPATVRVMCTNEELMIAHPVLRSFETILAD
jgi:acetate kinase